VFQGLPVVTNGVSQPPGLSQAGAGGILGAVVRLTAQAVATRFSRWFRGADIVDANSSRSATYGALATSMSRVPLVVHLHDMIDAEALGRFGLAAMTKLVLPNADGIVSCSRATLDTAEPYLRAEALTTVIPSAADLDIGHQRPPRIAGPLRIGMLARIDPWKGQLLLLEAFAQVHRDTDAVLEFAGAPVFGNEHYLDQLRARTAELGLDGRVAFLGQVADVPELLDRWDVAVQYSVRAEPLGQNVLQALAAGCAAIVADEGGPSEWVEDEVNGLRVPPRDPEALAATLRRLASDAQLRTRLANAAAATPGLMDNHDVMRAHAEFYDELLGRMPRRRRRPRAAASVDHQL
jgi:glycosyltransferase involved in cell wall biosynthesis